MQAAQKKLKDRLSEENFEIGMRNSLTVDPKMVGHIARKKALLAERLALLGMQRRDTPAYGDCQYIALARGLGWPEDAQGALR